MKRSEMIDKLDEILNSRLYQGYKFDSSELEAILKELVDSGMNPPKIEVKFVHPKTRWGAMCTMRCNCPDCNPNYLICAWEPEDA